ncbi:scavenger receptor class F member 1-like [Littorina saxatilis]|uniref:scavenger receptor class F member 1-like n=1 Tax=Littorina saxatilis TaxID=31220 RepID=UPI0038B4BA5A
MSGIHVEVDSQTCYTFPLLAVNATALDDLPEKIDVTCTPPLTGRVVRLQKRGQVNEYEGAHLINICEVQVWGCRDGLYGAECVEKCENCKGSDPCSAVSGHCPHGCQPGWQGDTCKQECDAGKYGNNCSSTCGHCNHGDACHHINGTCPRGCAAGFDPSDPLCKKTCQNGRHGENCSEQCGHCSENKPCNPVNGTCASCQLQFKPPLCKVCTGNWYGTSCELNCSTKCGGDGSCEKDTGRCVIGCVAGYRLGESGFCNETCEQGKYGEECLQKCGKCNGGCRHDNGHCVAGCEDGFEGDLCART